MDVLHIILFCIHRNESLGWFLWRNNPNSVPVYAFYCSFALQNPCWNTPTPPPLRMTTTHTPRHTHHRHKRRANWRRESHTAVRLMQTNDRGRALQKYAKTALWTRWKAQTRYIPQSANVLVHLSLSNLARKQLSQWVSKQMTTWKLVKKTLNSTHMTQQPVSSCRLCSVFIEEAPKWLHAMVRPI